MPLPTAIVRGARTFYRDAAGRFISRAKYELLQRRDPTTGRFLSAKAAARRVDNRKAENYLRAQLGAPPAGKSWVSIAAKYAERFEDYLADIEDGI